MHGKMIFRPARIKDVPAIKKLLKTWALADACITHIIEAIPQLGEPSDIKSRVLEIDKTLHCVMFWARPQPDEATIIALGLDAQALDSSEALRFIREAVIEWSNLKISKVTVRIPEILSDKLVTPLKNSGFMFEGISSCCGPRQIPRIHLCKHFLYKTVPYSKIIDFMKDFLISLGYEVRDEDDGFGFRLKNEYRLPFIFSPWHRITRSGPDIIIHPPARVLEMHELETLFYPFRVHVSGEKPLMLALERKRAEAAIEFPNGAANQDTLFDPESIRNRSLFSNDLAISAPSIMSHLRRGLPVLFYINKIGAVGVGRVEDYFLEESRNLQSKPQMAHFDVSDLIQEAGNGSTKAGKVLVVKYQWYRPFNRIVSVEEIKKVDQSFNPQHTKVLNIHLFQSIAASGYQIPE